ARLNRAHACLRARAPDVAEMHYRSARKGSGEIGADGFAAAVEGGLAALLQERGEWGDALRLYRRVRASQGARPDRPVPAWVDAARALGDRVLLGLALRGLGATFRIARRFDEARRLLEESIRTETEARDERHIGGALFHLGEIAAETGDIRRALGLLREAKR